MARQIVLDTETTGIDPRQGHRIVEIGCVEVVNRKLTGRTYHQYIQPEMTMEQEVMDVHGITNEFLQDKPLFHEVGEAFMAFIEGAQLVIHNAPFDIGFMDHEFSLMARRSGIDLGKTSDRCTVLDTLKLAKDIHPGQKNNLDALCKRYGIDNSRRTFHGALLDSEILADVYLAMTGGQTSLSLGQSGQQQQSGKVDGFTLITLTEPLKVLRADADEIEAHNNRLKLVKDKGGSCLWLGD